MSFGAHVARIWRRRFLVAVIALLAALLAVGVSMRHKGTQYTGIATLITVSQNSSPDQTASLAAGYVGTFIQPSFQRMLQAKLGLPADVSLTAQTAAQSPIIFISATAPDAATAQRFLRQASFGPGGEGAPGEEFGFEGAPEAFHVGVVVAVGSATHALMDLFLTQQLSVTTAGVLMALVAVVNESLPLLGLCAKSLSQCGKAK